MIPFLYNLLKSLEKFCVSLSMQVIRRAQLKMLKKAVLPISSSIFFSSFMLSISIYYNYLGILVTKDSSIVLLFLHHYSIYCIALSFILSIGFHLLMILDFKRYFNKRFLPVLLFIKIFCFFFAIGYTRWVSKIFIAAISVQDSIISIFSVRENSTRFYVKKTKLELFDQIQLYINSQGFSERFINYLTKEQSTIVNSEINQFCNYFYTIYEKFLSFEELTYKSSTYIFLDLKIEVLNFINKLDSIIDKFNKVDVSEKITVPQNIWSWVGSYIVDPGSGELTWPGIIAGVIVLYSVGYGSGYIKNEVWPSFINFIGRKNATIPSRMPEIQQLPDVVEVKPPTIQILSNTRTTPFWHIQDHPRGILDDRLSVLERRFEEFKRIFDDFFNP